MRLSGAVLRRFFASAFPIFLSCFETPIVRDVVLLSTSKIHTRCIYGFLRRYEVEVAEYIPIFLLREVERATFLRPE